MEDNPKKPFIHVEPGANMEHVVVRGNVFVGPGSFVKNEGQVSAAEICDNVHVQGRNEVTASASPRQVEGGKGGTAKDWHERAFGKIGIGVVIALLVVATLWVFNHYF